MGQFLSPAQAFDALTKLQREQIKLQRTGSQSLQKDIAKARLDLAEALERDKKIQAEYTKPKPPRVNENDLASAIQRSQKGFVGNAMRNVAQGALSDLAKGAVTAPFTAAPDILGMAFSPLKNTQARSPFIGLSGDPIRESIGLDPESPAGIAGEFLDPTAKLAKVAKGLAATPEGLSLGMTLFHGTPVKSLKGGNFDLRFIDTGEGQQVRGYGIYLAQREGIGRHYQNTLGKETWLLDGEPLPLPIADRIPDRMMKEASEGKWDFVDAAVERLRHEVKRDEMILKGLPSHHEAKQNLADKRFRLSAYEYLSDNRGKVEHKAGGSLLEVDIPDEITAGFIDLDAQMAKQPENVREVFEYATIDRPKTMGEATDMDVFAYRTRGEMPTVTESIFRPDEIYNYSGEDAYRVLAMRLAARQNMSVRRTKWDAPDFDVGDLLNATPKDWFRIANEDKKVLQKIATEYLLERGIDGMRFRDAASRTFQGGFIGNLKGALSEKRTDNLVVFNPERIERIVNKTTGEVIRDARLRGFRAGEEPELKEGYMRFRHFGKHDVDTLKVDKFGTGIRGEEQKRNPVPVISTYPDTGFRKEVGLGPHEYVIDVPKEKMYDMQADPLKLRQKAQVPSGSFTVQNGNMVPTGTTTDFSKMEQLVKKEGFFGYYAPNGQGRIFNDIPIGR